jgi:APA family basic amino acid/polyamine antiporter
MLSFGADRDMINATCNARGESTIETQPELKRSLTLPLVVLYGLGVTIGAGIYVLLGATSSVAGVYAPFAFVLAALVMLPSACSFAELVGRLPMSAGEAAYVRAGFNSKTLALIIGLMVVLVGTVSAAAISVGSVGYIRQFVDLPNFVLIPLIVAAMTLIAIWGVRESVSFAAVMTVIEIGGLLLIIGSGFLGSAELPDNASAPLVDASWLQIGFGVMSGGVLAFFAFIGFEDLVNMAEETRQPATTLPRAIFLTLAISTTLYVLVSIVAVLNVPINLLATAEAPLSLVFERTAGVSPATISAIAIIATLNGVIVQIIMGARVIYGLARQGSLPSVFGSVNAVTKTPVVASVLIGMAVYVLAAVVPLRGLAEATAQITLSIFAVVNLALWNIKRRGDVAPADVFIVRHWVPVVGFMSCCLFLVIGFL